MVEFAATSIIFFTLLFGVIEGGRLLFTYHQLTNAAREAARYAIAHGVAGESQVRSGSYQAMVDHAMDRTVLLDANSLEMTAEWPGDFAAGGKCPAQSNEAGCPVQVTVNYRYQPIVAMIFGPGTINLQTTSEMRIHY
jgi:Flp pilus assembly protein TadG